MRHTNVIVTGEQKVGKSTLLKSTLALLNQDYCGIFSRPVVENEVVGYGLTRKNAGEMDIFAHKKIKSALSLGPYKCDLGPFSRAAHYLEQCLADAAHFIVIDEIGVIEKHAPVYIEAAIKILDSPACALLVVQRRADYFWQILSSRNDCRLFEATPQNRDSLPQMLAQELQALLLKNNT